MLVVAGNLREERTLHHSHNGGVLGGVGLWGRRAVLSLLLQDHLTAVGTTASHALQGAPYLGLAIRQEEIGSTFVLGSPGAVDEELGAHPLLPLLPSTAEALQGEGGMAVNCLHMRQC